MVETVEISDLTDEELREYAESMGIKVRANSKRVTIEGLVAEAAAKLLDDELDAEAAADAAAAAAAEAEGDVVETPEEAQKKRQAKRYLLTLNSDGEVGGKEPQSFGINERKITIPRDIEVEVDGDVIAQLNDLVITEYEHAGEDDDGRPIMLERHRKRFSYSYRPVED